MFSREKVFSGQVMKFSNNTRANALCVCHVVGGVGYDAFGKMYDVITDDFGNVVFVGFTFRIA
jgi:hypothetical protein